MPGTGRPIDVTLSVECSLEEAVAAALAEVKGTAWLVIEAAGVATLDYVMPAYPRPGDDDHIAWYSETHHIGTDGWIERLGMVVGTHGAASFLHGHGIWSGSDGIRTMGHVLAPQTRLATPVKARGYATDDAIFRRLPDPETRFDLFRPRALTTVAPEDANVALLRVAPNEDLATALDTACAMLGWAEAEVHGLGSLNDVRLESAEDLGDMPTEFLVLDGRAQGRAVAGGSPEIAIVGLDHGRVLEGRPRRGDNPVLVTAELLLVRR